MSSIAIERAITMSDALDTRVLVVLAIPPRTVTCHPALVIRHLAHLLDVGRPRPGRTRRRLQA